MFLLQGIPETAGVIALSLALLRVPLRWKRIIAAGTLLALILFAVRSLPFTFGLHLIVGLLLLVIAINKTTNISTTKIFVAVFVSFCSLALLELIMSEIFTLAKLDINAIITGNYLLWKLLGLAQAFILIVSALLISKFRKPVENTWVI